MAHILEDYKRTIQRLEEVLGLEKNPINRDSAIKRFELCFDLAWKAVKSAAKAQGLECYSPRECFKVAFQLHFIDHDGSWLKMLDDRNTTAHLYKEESADKVYENLPEHLDLFKELLQSLNKTNKDGE